MEEGFRARAGSVAQLLADPSTAYVVVTVGCDPMPCRSQFFRRKLAERHIVPAALVVTDPPPLRSAWRRDD